MGSRIDLDHEIDRFCFSARASQARMEEHNLELGSQTSFIYIKVGEVQANISN